MFINIVALSIDRRYGYFMLLLSHWLLLLLCFI